MPLDYTFAIRGQDLSGPEWAKFTANAKAANQQVAALKPTTDSFVASAQRADTQVRALGTAGVTMGQTVSAGLGVMMRFIGPLAAGFTAVAAAHALWTAGMKAADLGEEASQIGLTTDELQAYRLAAAQGRVSTEQLDAAMMKLARSAGEANNGSDEMIAKFAKLDVKLLDSQGQLRRVGDLAPEVARGLLGMSSETERNALMMDLFGRSGARMVPILAELAKGNEEVIAAAREQAAIVGGGVSNAWDRLGDKLAVVRVQADAALAALGAPIATVALEAVSSLIEKIRGGVAWLGQFAREQSLADDRRDLGRWDQDISKQRLEVLKRERALQLLNAQNAQGPLSADAGAKAFEAQTALFREQQKLDDYIKSRRELQLRVFQGEARDAQKAVEALVSGSFPEGNAGAGQPVGKAAAGAASDIAKRERAESQKIYAEILADIERVRKAGEQMTDKFGDGSAKAARDIAALNEMLQLGYIDAETYAAAMREVTRAADDQARAFVGAKGGFDAYLAGFDQGIADLQRANSEFEIGKKAVDFFSDSIDALAGRATRSFGQIAIEYGIMVAKMEAARVGSRAWQELGGFSGLFGAVGSWLFGSGGGGASAVTNAPAFGSGFSGFFDGLGLASAGGGPLRAGQPSIVGEFEPELWVPNTGGNILNRQQLEALGVGGGGGDTIVVHMGGVRMGEFVSPSQHRRDLRDLRKAVEEGVYQALITRRRRGSVDLKGAFAT